MDEFIWVLLRSNYSNFFFHVFTSESLVVISLSKNDLQGGERGQGLGNGGIVSFAAFHESFSARLQILVTLSVRRYILQCVERMIKHTAISVQWNVKLVSKRRTLQWLLRGNAAVSND